MVYGGQEGGFLSFLVNRQGISSFGGGRAIAFS